MANGERRLSKEWRDFERHCVHVGAPAVQLREMRRAFYAGATSVLHLMTRDLDEGTDEVTEEDVAVLDGLAAELKAFADDVKQGRA